MSVRMTLKQLQQKCWKHPAKLKPKINLLYNVIQISIFTLVYINCMSFNTFAAYQFCLHIPEVLVKITYNFL